MPDERLNFEGYQIYDGLFCEHHGQEVSDNHGWYWTHQDGPRCLEGEREGDREAFMAHYSQYDENRDTLSPRSPLHPPITPPYLGQYLN